MIKQLINLTKCEQLLQQYIDEQFILQKVEIYDADNITTIKTYMLSTIKDIKKLKIQNKNIFYYIENVWLQLPNNFFITKNYNYKEINNYIFCPMEDILNENTEDKYIKIFKQCIENIELDVGLNNGYYHFTYNDLIEIQKCVDFLSNNNKLKNKIKYTIFDNKIQNKPLIQWFENRKDI